MEDPGFCMQQWPSFVLRQSVFPSSVSKVLHSPGSESPGGKCDSCQTEDYLVVPVIFVFIC